MSTTVSKDGTDIAFTRVGQGPPLILVDGALCHRASGPNTPLAKVLADRFTVYTYDRRGRGESGDATPLAFEHEVDDLRSLIDEAGGSAMVYGISSGAALALEAAARGANIDKLALYEAPFVVDDGRAAVPADYASHIRELVAADRRADAVKYFMGTGVGLNAFIVTMMRFMPAWSALKKIAHTLPYDVAITVDHQQGRPLEADRWASVTMPTLVASGGKSPAWIRTSASALADALPNGRHRSLPGQTHLVKPKALGPVLAEFFAD